MRNLVVKSATSIGTALLTLRILGRSLVSNVFLPFECFQLIILLDLEAGWDVEDRGAELKRGPLGTIKIDLTPPKD